MSRELRPTNMAEAFIKALTPHLLARPKPMAHAARKVVRAIERPGVGLVDNATGRRPPRQHGR